MACVGSERISRPARERQRRTGRRDRRGAVRSIHPREPVGWRAGRRRAPLRGRARRAHRGDPAGHRRLMARWHLLTVEYPPACGGVGDYSHHLATALSAAGDEVTVGVPSDEPPASDRGTRGIAVRALPDRFGPASRQVLEDALHKMPGIVLLQYVPTALGRHGTNVSFCRWLLGQRRRGTDVRVMFHEPYFYFTMTRPWRNAAAVAQRVMAALLLRASDPVYASTETWHRYLAPYGPVGALRAIAIPATVADSAPADAVVRARAAFGASAGEVVIGH